MSCQCKSCNCADTKKICDCDTEELIEIKGVCPGDVLRDLLDDGTTTWTQVFIPEILCLPCAKPDIEEIVKISSCVEIISKKVIKTPDSNGLNNGEGTLLTGRKLVIEGILRQKVIYTADVKEQSLHSAHFDVPFSIFIVLPADTLLSDKYKVEPYIEDIFVCKKSKREIFKNVTLFIKATKIQ
ncbi:DUF3794 domain-containing protein [Haloimpatiens sp. FM7330]|uniref:DUF3794 domain-containing protein n=1 Tax=Haloimpatiens sp. FM7330 TaxID=3298610 RepID=UPI0036380018